MEISLKHISEALELMPGVFAAYKVINGQLSCVFANSRIPQLLGLADGEYSKNVDPFGFILEEDKILVQKMVNECIQNKDFSQKEFLFRMQHKTNGFVWVHMTAKKVAGTEKDPLFFANVVDVTKEMNNSYSLMEASERSICVIEKATKRFLYANTAFFHLIDSTPAHAMGKYCYEILCRNMGMKTNDNCLCYSCLNAEKPIEIYNEKKDVYLAMDGREIMWGEYEAYVFFLQDITKQKRMDDLLEDAQKRFNVALENSDLMIWEYDMVNNRCINSEKAGRDYNIPLIIENYPESLFETGHTPPETVEQIKDVKRRLENGETGFSVERRTIDKYGKSNWQKVSYTLECDSHGKPVRAIVCGLDITAQKEKEIKLTKMSQKDVLTGLLNKDAFEKNVNEALKEFPTQNHALIFMDLDHFKELNDTLGHLKGDEVICDVANKLRIVFSRHDLLSRFGGDEYCIFIKDIAIDLLRVKMNWLIEKIDESYGDGEKPVTITASCGIACTEIVGFTYEELMNSADKALYYSKHTGRNRYTFFRDMK